MTNQFVLSTVVEELDLDGLFQIFLLLKLFKCVSVCVLWLFEKCFYGFYGTKDWSMYS